MSFLCSFSGHTTHVASVLDGGKKVTVQVVDSCPGCKRDDLDLSPAAFKKLNNLDAGQMQVTWKFLA